jgi:cell shape-determining protein MreD
VGTLALLAAVGGIWTDALSGNPLGVSVLPLFWVGLGLHWRRDLILRELPYAQCVLGGMATAAVPPLTLVVLLTLGEQPLVGWGTLWQILVVTIGGAALTPLCFSAIESLMYAFAYQPTAATPFPTDREIKRGRH